ncbi:MAG: zinc ribbon domain-containing protein [Candidatus Omnitrophica bacterium]|nr:zinc ribbon domain-containing protein [Candidatus Omnitrophota bacterium]
MTEKFLRRFEKLENIPVDTFAKEGIQISRRFERLEIGNKLIEVAITDRISLQEKAPEAIIYWVICPYCGAENTADSNLCVLCKHALRTKLAEETRSKASQMKKCSICGTVNHKERNNCWICGKNLFEDGTTISSEKATTNTIILNIDNKEYRSTDQNLPVDVKELIERIRREGYSQRLIDDWVKLRQAQAQEHANDLKDRINDLRPRISGLTTQITIGVIFIVLYLIFRIMASK